MSRYQVECDNIFKLLDMVKRAPRKSKFLVVFDEFFSSTDSLATKRLLIYTINELAKDKRCLVVAATHVMDIDDIKKIFPNLNVKIYHMAVDVDEDDIVFKHTKDEGMPRNSVAEQKYKKKMCIDSLGF